MSTLTIILLILGVFWAMPFLIFGVIWMADRRCEKRKKFYDRALIQDAEYIVYDEAIRLSAEGIDLDNHPTDW